VQSASVLESLWVPLLVGLVWLLDLVTPGLAALLKLQLEAVQL
jgi:hypothetical protein